MTTMICPKAGECKDKACRKSYSMVNHSVQHDAAASCEHPHHKVGTGCPKCVPYVQHKVGDWVRVLGKTHGFSLEYSGFKVGDVCKITRAFSETAYGTGQFQLNNEIRYHFNQQDLLPIQDASMPKEEAVKYKSIKAATALDIYANGNKTGCFLDHFASLLKELSPGFLNELLDFDKLIAWAEQIGTERIEWLLEKGYIEETQSEYDTWKQECPLHAINSGSLMTNDTLKFEEWAKRMPRE